MEVWKVYFHLQILPVLLYIFQILSYFENVTIIFQYLCYFASATIALYVMFRLVNELFQNLCNILKKDEYECLKKVLLKYPCPGLIWKVGPGCLCRFYQRFLAQNLNFMRTKILKQQSYTICFLYIDLTTWPNLTKFCSLTLAGASPPPPWPDTEKWLLNLAGALPPPPMLLLSSVHLNCSVLTSVTQSP